MTCIAADTDGTTVVLGADSASAGGNELRLRADTKVFKVGSYAIGFTTSFRMGQILRYCAQLPEPPAGAGPEELSRFMVTEFVPTVRREFTEQGFGKTARISASGDPNIVEEGQSVGGLFLVGVAGQIFEIRQDFQVAQPATTYSAVGSGAMVALGALYVVKRQQNLSPRERVTKALKAAEAYCPAVRGPFHFVELPKAN